MAWSDAQWEMFLTRVRVDLLRMGFNVHQGQLYAYWIARDHQTGRDRVFSSVGMDVRYVSSEPEALRAVRYWAQVTALHELEEQIYLDGVRPFDPHVNQPLPRESF